jgi:hypothetical protein
MRSILVFDGEYGPKMKALPNENWREFVRYFCEQGGRNAGTAYGKAFGIDVRDPGKQNTCDVGGYRLRHDERVLDAILECSNAGLRALAPLANMVMEEELTNRQGKDRVSAAKAVYDRTGLHAQTEHKVTVERIDQNEDKMRRIALMAATLGMTVEQLAGSRIASKAPMIDVTPEPIEADPWADVEY